ncbi:MAG TPA: malate synthase A [Acidimicrobiia bacterium]|nr:malate synthase A [Acidimicrobiia bacterium]
MNQFRHSEIERRVLTPGAVAFLEDLEDEFCWRRGQLLARRETRQRAIDAGELPEFLESTASVREDTWTIDPVPDDLQDRRVEITGPVDAKMMINALNSGARVFMADFEDATSPTWENLLWGQANLVEAYRRALTLETEAKTYTLNDEIATLVVRPRGWHLHEKHFLVDGRPMSASLFDFGLYMYHGGRAAIEAGTGPYFYLPKLESHLEARLWNDVFCWAQDRLGIPRGTIKATVLIENILAAFEMDEILYELREHAAGLNAGRWDYIFSVIKKFRNHPDFVLPDRVQVTMTVPFMHAYTELMVKTCHRRGAHAIGGMAAFIPNRRDPEVTEKAIAAVAADKAREAGAGCDGTWVAHPDLVPVAQAEFDKVLGSRPNQVDRQRDEVEVTAEDLLDLDFPGNITRQGVHTNVSVGIQYLAEWLSGTGAVAINNLMEDVATAEISRSQIWQWVRHGVTTEDGKTVSEALVRKVAGEVVHQLEAAEHPHSAQLQTARKVFEEVALSEDFVDFLTLPAYELIN